MAKVITDLDDFISQLNTLYNYSSTPPTEGDEDYTVWTALANTAVNIWEYEGGVLWKELFVKLADASDGDKTTTAGGDSYDCPSDFKFPASGYVWLGSNTSKTAYKVISIEQLQLHENSMENFCYFTRGGSSTLEFNPNLTLGAGQTINYLYYKNATALTTGSSTFEMADPMFAVYYALSELKKEEGNAAELTVATQKLNSMVDRNEMPAWFQEYNLTNQTEPGFNT